MDVLREAAQRSPAVPAVVGVNSEGRSEPPVWTYREVDQWAHVVAGALVRGGVAPGDRVAMRLPPCAEAVVLIHSVSRAGATLVPLNASWTDAEFARGLTATGPPSLIFTTEGEVVGLEGEGPEDYQVDETALPGPGSGAPAALVLTSGSTGTPHPVPVTHRNLTASARGVIQRLDLQAGDRWLTSLSPGHVGGLVLIHRAAAVGCTLVTRPRFDALEVAELMEAGEFTHASLVPVMLRRLMDARGTRPAPASLRCLLLGGAPMPVDLLERALTLNYPVALTYGLTEATSQVATAPPALVREKPGTVGRPLDGVEVRVDAPGPDGVGELLVRGPTVVRQVPVRPALRSDQAPSVYLDEVGWLHTGDLGRMDQDGDLWVVGRISDRIVTAGVTVEPNEVEAVLVRHPKVEEVAVIGTPDPEWGERVVAVVVPRNRDDPPTLGELQAFTQERLASAKRPRDLRIVDRLPRNASGKVTRNGLGSQDGAR